MLSLRQKGARKVGVPDRVVLVQFQYAAEGRLGLSMLPLGLKGGSESVVRAWIRGVELDGFARRGKPFRKILSRPPVDGKKSVSP